MFRKNEAAGEEWSPENVQMCAERQRDILEYACQMLRPGGRLCYSTCTFAPAEDEGSVGWLIKKHPDMHVLSFPMPEGFAPGHPEWADMEEAEDAGEDTAPASFPAAGTTSVLSSELEHTMRLWPHRLRGEGHFVAVLEKNGAAGTKGRAEEAGRNGQETEKLPAKRARRRDGEKGLGEKDYAEFSAFAQENLRVQLPGIYLRFGEQLYLAPEETPVLRGLKVLRPGLHLGTVKKNRFEPSHALALTLKPEQAAHAVSLDTEGRQEDQDYPEDNVAWFDMDFALLFHHHFLYLIYIRRKLPLERAN